MSHVRDYRFYQHKREVAARRAVQDARDAARHREFSLSAQDRHHKYERAHFAVVGEGSRTAQDNFRAGWDRVFGAKERA
jgi:hypothetical protein